MHVHSGGEGVVGITNSLKDGSSDGARSTALDSSPGLESKHNAHKLPMHLTVVILVRAAVITAFLVKEQGASSGPLLVPLAGGSPAT